jgi:hypothetical protein
VVAIDIGGAFLNADMSLTGIDRRAHEASSSYVIHADTIGLVVKDISR